MKTLGLALTLIAAAAAGACGGFGSGTCEDDPGARHHAVNPATGECWEFTSSCDVPPEWATCGGDPECDDTHACPPDRTCQAGVCVLVGAGCTSDLDCPDTQHCQWASPSPEPSDIAYSGACVDNNTCSDDSNCPDGQWCDWSTGDCDPNLPDCGIAAGLCSRAPRPGTCATDLDCATGLFCLAPLTGEPVCEPACTGGANECAADEYCTTDDGYCLSPPVNGGGGAPLPPLCYGWCETRPGLCDNTFEDCQPGEVCTSEATGTPPGTCETACYDDTLCVMGEHCNAAEVCLQPHGKPDPGSKHAGAGGGASGHEADGDALIPICAGWCLP